MAMASRSAASFEPALSTSACVKSNELAIGASVSAIKPVVPQSLRCCAMAVITGAWPSRLAPGNQQHSLSTRGRHGPPRAAPRLPRVCAGSAWP